MFDLLAIAPLALESSLARWALVAARIVPSVLLVPVFGAPSLPWVLRLGLGGALAAWFTGAMASQPAFLSKGVGGVGWLVSWAYEATLGLTLAFVVWCAFAAARLAGQLQDLARRGDEEGSLDPVSAEPSSPLGSLYVLLAVLIFAELGGPGALITAWGRSFELVPLGGGVMPSGVKVLGAMAGTVAGLFEVALGLAAPVWVAVWLSDVVFAVAGRLGGGMGQAVVAGATAAAPLVVLGTLLLGLGLARAALEGWVLQVPGLVLYLARVWADG